MWAGSLLGIISSLQVSSRICTNGILIARDRQHTFSRDNTPIKSSNKTKSINGKPVEDYILDEATPDMNAEDASDEASVSNEEQSTPYVDYRSLPLMRRFFAWSIVLVISFVVILVSQSLFYLWFVGMIGIWDAVFALSVLLISYMFYMYLMQIFKLVTCLIYTLLVIQLELFALKEEGSLREQPWLRLIWPLVISLLIIGYCICKLLLMNLSGRMFFSLTQSSALLGYVTGYLFVASAVALTAFDSYFNRKKFVNPAYICWTIAIPILVYSGLSILLLEINRITESRGYSKPQVLRRTSAGWDVLESTNNPLSWILGEIKMENPSLKDIAYKSRIQCSRESSKNCRRKKLFFNPPETPKPVKSSKPGKGTANSNQSITNNSTKIQRDIELSTIGPSKS